MSTCHPQLFRVLLPNHPDNTPNKLLKRRLVLALAPSSFGRETFGQVVRPLETLGDEVAHLVAGLGPVARTRDWWVLEF